MHVCDHLYVCVWLYLPVSVHFPSWRDCCVFVRACVCACVCVHAGRQLTIFNSQTTVRVGGGERGTGMFQGQLSGLYYNGLRILNMAAEGHPHIRVEGSARLVGDMPSSSITPQSSAAAGGNRSDSAPSISDITTTTATNRKQGSTQQVSTNVFSRFTYGRVSTCISEKQKQPIAIINILMANNVQIQNLTP